MLEQSPSDCYLNFQNGGRGIKMALGAGNEVAFAGFNISAN